MADDWVETTVRELERWAGERERPVDGAGAGLLLGLARDQLSVAGAAELTPEVVRALLIEAFPEAVVAAPEDAPAVIRALDTLADFLGETGAVPQERADRLRSELAEVEPGFTRLLGELDASEQESAAELLAGMMVRDGIDLDDGEAVEGWLTKFESLSENERLERTTAYLDEVDRLTVPPVRLAPEAELAAAARASSLTRQATALAGWTGERDLTGDDELTPDDALTAVEALGLATPRRTGEGRPETLEDVPELARLWWAAVHAQLIEAENGRATAGPALGVFEDGDDGTVLATWLELFDGVAVVEHEPAEVMNASQVVQNELTGVLIQLYEQDAPSTREKLFGILYQHILEAYEIENPGGALQVAFAGALDLELDDLDAWGVVLRAEDGGYELTPLGVWAVRELLRADGFHAPLVGDLTGEPAAELVAGLVWHREDTADEEIDRWLAIRPAEDAAAELIKVMSTGTPGARNLAAAVLHRIGPGAEPVVRVAFDDRLVRPYAALWLHEHTAAGTSPELSSEEMTWVFIDTLAGMMETAEPADAVRAALGDAPPGADVGAVVDSMWRVEHPDVADVLEALGAHHPDKQVAKAARKAAYKARSV